ncbi:MAG TPA: hypothetical protein VG983_07605, partial [Caulobacterales bacterium]|nr:hypothetical protein [Caulobacterales bacterium]
PPGAPPAPPPVFIGIPPAMIADLLIAVALIYDWRTRGKPHPVWIWGGAAVVIEELLRLPISSTPAWRAIANAIVGIMG